MPQTVSATIHSKKTLSGDGTVLYPDCGDVTQIYICDKIS